MAGWISLHRKIQDNWLWSDKPFSKGQAWIDILLLAGSEERKVFMSGEVIQLKDGSFITSELKLMDRWGWSKSKVRNFLNLLQSEGMIIKESDQKKTTIFVEKYNNYQKAETTKRPQPESEKTAVFVEKYSGCGKVETTERPQKRPPKRPPKLLEFQQHKESENHVKDHKKDTNNNIYNIYTLFLSLYKREPDEKMVQALQDFIDLREKKGNPLDEKGIEILLKKLESIAQTDDERIRILEDSVLNKWQDIYPLKYKTVDKPVDKLCKGVDKPKKQNKFHNFSGKMQNYTETELEEIVKKKFEKKVNNENRKNDHSGIPKGSQEE